MTRPAVRGPGGVSSRSVPRPLRLSSPGAAAVHKAQPHGRARVAEPGRESTAQLTIVSPEPGATISGTVMHVRLALNGAVIVPQTSTHLTPDRGHVHLLVDGRVVSMAYGLAQDVPVTPGPHPPSGGVRGGHRPLSVQSARHCHRHVHGPMTTDAWTPNAMLAPAAICVGVAALLLRPFAGPGALAVMVGIGLLGVLTPAPIGPSASPRAGVAAAAAVGVGAFALARVLHGGAHAEMSASALLPPAVAAVAEEAFFRRLVYGWLSRTGPAFAVAGSTPHALRARARARLRMGRAAGRRRGGSHLRMAALGHRRVGGIVPDSRRRQRAAGRVTE